MKLEWLIIKPATYEQFISDGEGGRKIVRGAWEVEARFSSGQVILEDKTTLSGVLNPHSAYQAAKQWASETLIGLEYAEGEATVDRRKSEEEAP